MEDYLVKMYQIIMEYKHQNIMYHGAAPITGFNHGGYRIALSREMVILYLLLINHPLISHKIPTIVFGGKPTPVVSIKTHLTKHTLIPH